MGETGAQNKKQTIMASDQKSKFMTAAKNACCDESEASFDAKLKQVATSPPPKDERDKSPNK